MNITFSLKRSHVLTFKTKSKVIQAINMSNHFTNHSLYPLSQAHIPDVIRQSKLPDWKWIGRGKTKQKNETKQLRFNSGHFGICDSPHSSIAQAVAGFWMREQLNEAKVVVVVMADFVSDARLLVMLVFSTWHGPTSRLDVVLVTFPSSYSKCWAGTQIPCCTCLPLLQP
jgi:ABC-type cobalamin transport system ATPase subunit